MTAAVKRGSRRRGARPAACAACSGSGRRRRSARRTGRGNRRPGRRRSASAATRAAAWSRSPAARPRGPRSRAENVTPCASASQRASAGIASRDLDPQLVRAPQAPRAGRRRPASGSAARPRPPAAARSPAPISVARKASSTATRLRPARDHGQAAMLDPDAGRRRHLDPDVARAHGAPPALAALLAGDGDEAEIADRGAVGLRVAVDHHDALSPRRAAASAWASPQMPAPTIGEVEPPAALRSALPPGLRAGEVALRDQQCRRRGSRPRWRRSASPWRRPAPRRRHRPC